MIYKINRIIPILFLSIFILTACDLSNLENKNGNTNNENTNLEMNEENTDQNTENKIFKEVEFQALKHLDTNEILKNYKSAMIAEREKDFAPVEDWKTDIADYYDFYDAGEIKIEPYKGQRLIILDLGCDGPCGSASVHRFAYDQNSGNLIWLSKLSNLDYVPAGFNALKKNKDDNFTIKKLEVPQIIMTPDGRNVLNLSINGIDLKRPKIAGKEDYYFVKLGKVAFKDAKVGDVYFADDQQVGCLFIITPDSVISSYTYDDGLMNSKFFEQAYWNDNSTPVLISEVYAPYIRGCGIGNYCYFVDDIKKSDLKENGKSTKGIVLYENKNSESLRDTYEAYAEVYDYWFNSPEDTQTEKPPVKTFEEFLADHPVFYREDPFGRFTAYIKQEYVPPAECGKPVIYLYPEKNTEVSVKVDIKEFTKTEPKYGENGWKVIAKPNGELINLEDNKVYPYLFWEGYSDKEVSINNGFVVEKKDVNSFLSDNLAKLGLNEKESSDFKEFWIPKMLASKGDYLRVSFVGTQEFNKVAPLTISPKPDSLIRVFMFYQPLKEKISIAPQKLSAIERKGFTVVEWGGTSSDGWQYK